jgi:hypothetical protein
MIGEDQPVIPLLQIKVTNSEAFLLSLAMTFSNKCRILLREAQRWCIHGTSLLVMFITAPNIVFFFKKIKINIS